MENNNQFQIETPDITSQKVIIRLGENVLGGSEALSFASSIDELAKKKYKNVIIDLSRVVLMNSSGLGMLVSAHSSLRKYGVNLLLSGVPAKVSSLLQMTHLDKVFSIYNDLNDALKNCS